MISSFRIAQLQDMLKEDSNDIFLQYALGLEYAKEEITFSDAEAQFKLAIQLDENYLAAYYQLGQLYEQWQKVPEALEYYKIGQAKAKTVGNRKSANEFEEAIFLLED